MYKIEWEKEAWMLAVMAAVAIGVMMTYPYLPDTLPVHWNVYGEVDRSVPKSPMNAFFHLGITWGIYLLMLFVPYIDPKRDRYGSFLEAYRLIRFSTVAVLCMMSVLVTLWALGYKVPMEKVVPAVCGVLYIFMGNLMGKVRMNWFVGFRMPWTMENEEVWNRTNRMGGRLFVAAGILTLFGALLPGFWTFVVMFTALSLSVVITVVYGFLEYDRQKQREKGGK